MYLFIYINVLIDQYLVCAMCIVVFGYALSDWKCWSQLHIHKHAGAWCGCSIGSISFSLSYVHNPFNWFFHLIYFFSYHHVNVLCVSTLSSCLILKYSYHSIPCDTPELRHARVHQQQKWTNKNEDTPKDASLYNIVNNSIIQKRSDIMTKPPPQCVSNSEFHVHRVHKVISDYSYTLCKYIHIDCTVCSIHVFV